MELIHLNPHDINWAVRRMPKPVVGLLKQFPRTSCVAGGFIRSCIANEKINDIDIFGGSVEQSERMASFLSLGAESLDQLDAFEAVKRAGGRLQNPPRTIVRTENALTVRGFPIDPQIIHRWTFGDVMDVIPSFDFSIACAMIFWCNRQNRWEGFAAPTFYQDLAAKRLVYLSPVRNEDAGGSMLRAMKFASRGYRMPLDSLGAVMARMIQGVKKEDWMAQDEQGLARILTSLLVEVDPSADPTHEAHIASLENLA